MNDSLQRFAVALVAILGLSGTVYFYMNRESAPPVVSYVEEGMPTVGVFIIPGKSGNCSACITDLYRGLEQFHEATFVLLPQELDGERRLLSDAGITTIAYRRINPVLLNKVIVRHQPDRIAYAADIDLLAGSSKRELFQHISQFLK